MTCLTIPRPLLLASLALALLTQPVLAHEFWIAPERYQIAPDENLVAQFKNGENFEGINLAFFDRRSTRFEWVLGDRTEALSPRMGNVPALDIVAPGEGLVVIAHETAPSSIKYNEWEDFRAFADHKDFPDIKARHQARGLPETGFSEKYTRHAKALVAVGDPKGSDRVLGLETEFVALANPYLDDLGDGLPVVLYYQGNPRANAQVEIFERAPDGTVSVSLTRTNAAGQAIIPVASGHDYLIDAVVLREGPEWADDVWETLWAALTFRVP